MSTSGACPKCGTALRSGAAFCAGCGSEVPRATATGATGTVIAPTPVFAATPTVPAPPAPAAPAPAAAPSVPVAPAATVQAPAPPPMSAPVVPQRASGGGRMHWSAFVAIAGLATAIAGSVTAGVGAILSYGLAEEFKAADPTTFVGASSDFMARANQADTVYGGGQLIYVVGLIISAVFFITWLYIAYGRVAANGFTGDVLRRSRGQAIWAWFVPIFNVYRPVQIVADCYRASIAPAHEPVGDAPAGAAASEPWTARRLPAVIGLWWAGFIISGVLNRVSSNADDQVNAAASLADLSAPYSTSAACYLLLPISLALAILVVLKIARLPVQRT